MAEGRGIRPQGEFQAHSGLRRRIPLFSLIAVVILLIISTAGLFYLSEHEKKADQRVADTLSVQESARQYHVLVQNAVISQRGFLLTGQDAFLTAYRGALAAIPDATAELRDLARDNPAQMSHVDEMERLVERLLGALAVPVATALAGENVQAMGLVEKASVDEVLERFRLEVDAFLDEEDQRLRERKEKKLQAEEFVFVMSFFTFLVMGGLIASVVFVAWTQERTFRDAEQTLKKTNMELERRVLDRTIQLKAERERVESLLRDLNHRVGNNLQLVVSFLGLQANQTESEEARRALNSARERVLSIASAQRRLRLTGHGETVEAASFLGAIVEDMEANFDAEHDVTIECSAADASIPSKDAISIGVIATELVTNALKHAFAGLPGGTIRVSLTTRNKGGNFQLEVADDGVGLNTKNGNSNGGLGTRIIERLSAGLGGNVERAENASGGERPGTVVRVTFPNPNLI